VRRILPVGIELSSFDATTARIRRRPAKLAARMADGTRPTLAVDERPERGTRATRRLRRQGLVPGVVYGGGSSEAVSFKVDARVLRQVLVDGSALIDLQVAGQTRPVIVKDQQLHPVRDEVVHIDLLEVRLDEKIQTQVGIQIEGAEEAPGIKEGGVLEHVTHQLNIEALPTAIPDAIVVDVSGMAIAATMHLSELDPPEGVTFLDDPDETIIATVVVPTEVEEPEEIEEETELVGEEAEAEAAAEGATGEEAEAAGESAAEEAGEGE
jgi:large subunit ribosomal protein L25